MSQQMTEKRVVRLLLLILPAIWFYPAIAGELALVQGDGWTGHLGLLVLTGRLLAGGEAPLWNPYIYAGAPLMASISPGSLFPSNWVFAFLPPGAAMTFVVMTAYYLALIGTYLYARAIGLGRIASLAAGLAFAFGGFMTMTLGQVSLIATAAGLPWIVLAIERLHKNPSWRWVALGAVFIALQIFAGAPQAVWYTALTAAAYSIVTLVRRTTHRRRFAISVGAMALCGLLLSAVQLLPLRELQQQSVREGLSYEAFAAYSFPPRQMLALVFPYFFGGAASAPYSVPYWGEWGIFVTCGYVGVLGLLLALVAVFGVRRRLVRFWAVCAIAALLLSFGDYLPFGANHLLYRLPVYNLFRTSSRHMLEYTFAAAVLAGMGFDHLSRRMDARRALKFAIAVITGMVCIAALAYCVFASRKGSPLEFEFIVPVVCCIAGVFACRFYAGNPALLRGILPLAVLFADLWSFGQFLDWSTYRFRISDALADPAAVRFLKQHETSAHDYRLLSYSRRPFGENYEALNWPNVSIARGVQSVNGYDMLLMHRTAQFMGAMSPDGVVHDVRAFDDGDRSFDLLNVKYLLCEKQGQPATGNIVHEGVRFDEEPIYLPLGPRRKWGLALDGITATELAMVAAMGGAAHLPDQTTIARVGLRGEDGRVVQYELKAGRDSAEWAYDRTDVIRTIKHRRAQVVESWDAGGFEGHRYLARIRFERMRVTGIEIEYSRPDAELSVLRASLHDAETGESRALTGLWPPQQRWRKAADFGRVEIYENMRAMPRAWFAGQVRHMNSTSILRTIRESRFEDGQPFDPAQIALIEHGPQPQAEIASLAKAEIVHYTPQRIEIHTTRNRPGFLVLGEIWYPGWEAHIDGRNADIYRTNYVLRGVAVPEGEHRVEFVYRPGSVYIGALVSVFGVAALIVGGFVWRLCGREKNQTCRKTAT
ncbi:MAG: YfhO family protein [Blastocatellales bacterium]|nr:YfhO family protein [Blastocatellales bacterium]